MTFNIKPHEIEAFRILRCPQLAKELQCNIVDDSPLSGSEALALQLAFKIARKTLEQFPRLKKQLLLEKEKTDD
jgi:hypothetical protein